ncbi:MAG: NAD-dependent epimerase/dehydratase family protein, partial [Candidatus Hydrogenedentes bacterium]|nr:NAD-dependent epimerase/dehydratase family protein [Candidatus Hydrogenedentota bacterium]
MACYLVTGGAGFIGSNLVEALLERGDEVRVVDDFSTGRHSNIESIESSLTLFEGSICDEELLREAFDTVDYCLHLAAIPSVPRSIEDPVSSNGANIDGTLKVFMAARDAGAKRVVCASSSAVYGNTEAVPSHEALPAAPISPYGVTKTAGEMYAAVCSDLYDIDIVTLRYFNVFGPRQ